MFSATALPAAEAASLLVDVLANTPSATALGRPGYAPDGTLAEVTLAHLNPAGQALLGQPEQPAAAFSACFPAAQRPAVLALCQQVASTAEPGQLAVACLPPPAGRSLRSWPCALAGRGWCSAWPARPRRARLPWARPFARAKPTRTRPTPKPCASASSSTACCTRPRP